MTDFIQRYTRGRSRRQVSEREYRKKQQEERLQQRREIQRYVAGLTAEGSPPLKEHPDAEMFVFWMRECRRAELYDAGKVLYEKGPICLAELTEHQQVSVSEDYMICMRVLSRQKAQEPDPDQSDEGQRGPEREPDALR